MDLLSIYDCLGERTRLRIVHLLLHGPLCVCHVQEILGESQVKISKHLGHLKKHGLVTARKEANWRIYTLIAKPSPALAAQLDCLRAHAPEDGSLRRDAKKLQAVRARLACDSDDCCGRRTTPRLTITA